MKPAFLKVIANKEALRIRHGTAEEEMSSIHLRHLPRSPVLSPPWPPTPSGTPVPAPCHPPPPTQAAVSSAVAKAQTPRASFHRSGSPQPGRRHGEALPGAASPPSHPAGSGDSPPPETAEKLGRECQPRPFHASSATPARRPSELSPPSCYLPSAHPARERGAG